MCICCRAILINLLISVYRCIWIDEIMNKLMFTPVFSLLFYDLHNFKICFHFPIDSTSLRLPCTNLSNCITALFH